jgi:predicted cupin superfamily sugar epimerase
MTVVELNENEVNHCKLTVLGQNIFGNELVQYTVKANTWFGCYSNPGSKFSFVGCTVSPGFDFQDFELGSGSKLLEIFPNAREVIDKLTIGLP